MPTKKPASKKPATKKVPAKKVPAKKVPAKKAVAKKVAAKTSSAKKPVATKTPAKKVAVKKVAAKTSSAKKPVATKTPAKKVAAKKVPAKSPVKVVGKKATGQKTATPKTATPKTAAVSGAKKITTAKGAAAKGATPKVATVSPAPSKAPIKPVKAAVEKKAPVKAAPKKAVFVKPPVPGKKAVSKDGIVANKDFDLAFLRARRTQLVELRDQYLGQVAALDRERELLIEASGMGDDQFDEDGGEGDTLAVERERAKLLSDQDRQIVLDIEAALTRIETGDYGYSIVSTKPIPRERLEFIPWAVELVSERVGGIGQR